MAINEELNELWQKAITENPCICETDDMWNQDLHGSIQCDLCKYRVVDLMPPVDRFFIPKERQEVKNILKDLQSRGYQYVVRDKEAKYLSCFTHKPQKFKEEDHNFWGYKDGDLRYAKPCELISNYDVMEINWSNRSATLITTFLEKG